MNAGLVVVKVETVETGYTIPRGYPYIAVVIACEVRDGVARQSVGSGIVGEGSLQVLCSHVRRTQEQQQHRQGK